MSIYIGPILNNTSNLLFQADFYKRASLSANSTTFIKNLSTFSNHGTGASLTLGNNYINFSSASISIPQFNQITGSGSRTLISIVRPSGSGNMGLFDFGGSGESGAFMGVFIDSGQFPSAPGQYNSGGFALSLSGTDYFVKYPTISGSGLYDNNWHFIGISYEQSNKNISICIDGSFPNRNDGTTQPFANSFNLQTDPNSSNFSGIQYFGKIKTGYYTGFTNLTGDISHISIYNKSHTTGELVELYKLYRNRLTSGVF
jgi:hypothetical protein